MATMLQSFDLSQQEMEWVCDHLGHNLNIHRIHYRATSDVIERLHVAKILLTQDNPLLVRFQGKHLSEIPLEGLVRQLQNDKTEPNKDLEDQNKDPEDLELEKATMQLLEPFSEEEEYIIPTLPQVDDDDRFESTPKVIAPKGKKKKMQGRHTRTADEIYELRQLFSNNFEENLTPGTDAVKRADAESK